MHGENEIFAVDLENEKNSSYWAFDKISRLLSLQYFCFWVTCKVSQIAFKRQMKVVCLKKV
jgi:amino acid permease